MADEKDIIITNEKIATLFQMYDEHRDLEFKMTDCINTAKERNGENKVSVERKVEGKMRVVQVQEKHLWDEVYHLGPECQAAGILKAKYPDVFHWHDQAKKKAAEIKTFEIATFGFDHANMTLPNVIRLVRALVRNEQAAK